MPGPEAIIRLLLKWYARHARDLPWRRTTDPYAIWISEVMLQQTQVQTVIPYWGRWMRELPDVPTLAQANLDRILKLWEGLGYYTRARSLHRAAKEIVKHHGGCFPTTYQTVLELPGIGRYTAGAICSIAFNQPTPILDGNVVRVLARLFEIDGNVRQSRVRDTLWALANSLVQTAARTAPKRIRACSHFNQALMELGATVCRAKTPECLLCPVATFCGARRTGRIDALPNLGLRPATRQRRYVALVVSIKGRFLIRQRPDGVVNARLWEFPNLDVTDSSGSIQEIVLELLGCWPASVTPLRTIRHSITRNRIQLDAYLVELPSEATHEKSPAGEWRTLRALRKLAFPSAHRKVIDGLPQ